MIWSLDVILQWLHTTEMLECAHIRRLSLSLLRIHCEYLRTIMCLCISYQQKSLHFFLYRLYLEINFISYDALDESC